MKNSTLLSKLGFSDPDHKSSQHDAAIHFVRQPAMLAQIGAMFDPPDKDKLLETTKAYSIPGDLARVVEVVKEIEYATESPITKGNNQYKQTIGFIDGYIRYSKSFVVAHGFQPILFEATAEDLDMLKKGKLERYPNAFCLPDAVVQEGPVMFRGLSLFRPVHDGGTAVDDKSFSGLYELIFSPHDGRSFSSKSYEGVFRADKKLDPLKPIQRVPYWTNWIQGWINVKHHNVGLETKRSEWKFETKFHKTSAADILRQVNLYREDWDDSRWFALTFFDLSELEQNELSNANIYWIRMGSKFDEWWKEQQRPAKQARLVF